MAMRPYKDTTIQCRIILVGVVFIQCKCSGDVLVMVMVMVHAVPWPPRRRNRHCENTDVLQGPISQKREGPLKTKQPWGGEALEAGLNIAGGLSQGK